LDSLSYRGNKGLKIPSLQLQQKSQIEVGFEKFLDDLDQFFFGNIGFCWTPHAKSFLLFAMPKPGLEHELHYTLPRAAFPTGMNGPLPGVTIDNVPGDSRQLGTLAELTEALLETNGEEWLRQQGDVILDQWEMRLNQGFGAAEKTLVQAVKS
jgi:hypothetical protein